MVIEYYGGKPLCVLKEIGANLARGAALAGPEFYEGTEQDNRAGPESR